MYIFKYLIGGVLFSTGCLFAAVENGDFENIKITHGPYIQELTPTSATVIWTTDKPAVSWVEIAPDDGSHFYEKERPQFYQAPLGRKVVSTLHKVKIDSLEPNKTYNYCALSKSVVYENSGRTYYGRVALTPVYKCVPPKFRTLDESKKSIKFSVVNDIHERAALLKNMLSRAPKDTDFLLLNGDMVHQMKSQEQMFTAFMDVVADFGKGGTPVFFSRGNHETRGQYSEGFLELFPTNTGKTYYTFKVGQVFFVVLDGGEDKPDNNIEYYGRSDFDNFRARQAKWLKGVVDSAEFKNAPVKILISHIPPAWGSWHGSKHFQKEFAEILNRTPFSLIISGHLHKYEFYEPSSLINIPNVVNSNNEMMNVAVDSENITLDFVDENGKKARESIVLKVRK